VSMETTSMRFLLKQILAAALVLSAASAAEPPIVSEISISPSDTPLTTETVTLSVTATSAAGLTLTYVWDFGDGSPAGAGASVNHVFALAEIYIVSVEVSDGVNPAVSSIAFVESIEPPAPDDVIGVNDDDVVSNPDNGLSIKVESDQGSFIELFVDDSAFTPDLVASRAAGGISTDWGDGIGRAATGNRPRHNYESEGIFTVTVSVVDPGSGSPVGRARKTIAVSGEAVGAAPKVKNPPPMNRRDVTVTKVKGKFNFADKAKKDLVNVTFEIDLPEGLKLGVARELTLSLGNITEKVNVDAKGKGTGVKFTKVNVKYPRLKKGITETPAGLIARVQAQIAAADLNENGFDTEGVSSRAKNLAPNIQVALLLDGVAYSDQAGVQLKVTPKGDAGLISRAASKRLPAAP
jgi:hypothetical protein